MSYSKYYNREDKAFDYDPNVDYMKKMQEAAEKGDMEAAARYEQQRNEKIKGEGLTQYEQTSNYAQYLPKSTAQQLDEILEQIKGKKPFEFDLDGDAFYQQYKEKFGKNAQLAMEDVMAQATALTGGYGNSYAQTVGQQAYQQQMDRLNDIVPEVYARQRAEYDAEKDDLYRQLSLLSQQEALEYSRDQDAYNRELYESEKAEAEAKAQQDKAYELALTMLKSGMMPSEGVLSASGLSSEDAQKIYDYSTQSMMGSSGGGSSGGGGGYGGGTKLKTLPKTDMEELRDLFNEGSKKNDLNAFYNQKSLLAALGYDVSAFDSWAGQEYDGYTADKPQGVTYNKYGVEDITDLIRRISTSSNADVIAMMEELDGQFTKEQWEKIEPILINRGIFG